MSPQDIRPDDRETLSALFDGELDGEARLFALRRLGHDESWQRACGQWQLVGDVMRRHAPIAAPSDFAARVRHAVAAEPVASPAPTSFAPRPPRWRTARWIGGGAIAASVALALAVSTLPLGGDVAGEGGTTVAVTPPVGSATPAPVAAIAAAPAVAPVVSPSAEPGLDQPAAVATAESSPRIATAAPRRQRPAPTAIASARSDLPSNPSDVAMLVGRTGNPFNLEADEALTARPWPRTGVAGTAFTAGYGASGDSSGERPSFYPFEPRPPGEAEPAQLP